jgi:allantoin racemase
MLSASELETHAAAPPARGARVLVAEPVTPTLFSADDLADMRALLRPGGRLDVLTIPRGPRTIQTAQDERAAAREVIPLVVDAAGDYDAVVVACTLDVGVGELRDRVSAPVIGPGLASMQLAVTLGGRFSIVVAMPDGVSEMSWLSRRHGYFDQLASVRSLGIPIEALTADRARTAAALVREAELAVAEDEAATVVLGCTLASSARAEAQAQVPHVPLIDPLTWSIQVAEAAALHGVRP